VGVRQGVGTSEVVKDRERERERERESAREKHVHSHDPLMSSNPQSEFGYFHQYVAAGAADTDANRSAPTATPAPIDLFTITTILSFKI
jgi:hypothetical protein